VDKAVDGRRLSIARRGGGRYGRLLRRRGTASARPGRHHRVGSARAAGRSRRIRRSQPAAGNDVADGDRCRTSRARARPNGGDRRSGSRGRPPGGVWLRGGDPEDGGCDRGGGHVLVRSGMAQSGGCVRRRRDVGAKPRVPGATPVVRAPMTSGFVKPPKGLDQLLSPV